MVKYATALRLTMAEAEQVLRRFTRGGPKHPTYQALEELGEPPARSFSSRFPVPQLLTPEAEPRTAPLEDPPMAQVRW